MPVSKIAQELRTAMKDTWSRISAIAPYPDTAEEATAEAMIKYAALEGSTRNHFMGLPFSGFDAKTDQDLAMGLVYQFSVAFLLDHIRQVSPETADEVSRELWEHLVAGDTPAALLHELLRDMDIDTSPLFEATTAIANSNGPTKADAVEAVEDAGL